MLRRVSEVKILVTVLASTVISLHKAPTSLANATLSAWKALHMYFTISAVVRVVSKICVGAQEYSSWSAERFELSELPMTVNGGSKKSATAVPSRRNSGLEQMAKSRPARLPLARSRVGVTS